MAQICGSSSGGWVTYRERFGQHAAKMCPLVTLIQVLPFGTALSSSELEARYTEQPLHWKTRAPAGIHTSFGRAPVDGDVEFLASHRSDDVCSFRHRIPLRLLGCDSNEKGMI